MKCALNQIVFGQQNTYVRTTDGWRYLAVWMDLISRRVVGWKLDQRMDAALVIEALNRALSHRRF